MSSAACGSIHVSSSRSGLSGAPLNIPGWPRLKFLCSTAPCVTLIPYQVSIQTRLGSQLPPVLQPSQPSPAQPSQPSPAQPSPASPAQPSHCHQYFLEFLCLLLRQLRWWPLGQAIVPDGAGETGAGAILQSPSESDQG